MNWTGSKYLFPNVYTSYFETWSLFQDNKKESGQLNPTFNDTGREMTKLSVMKLLLAEGITNLNGEYLEGIATVDGRMILILQLNEILKVGESVSSDSITVKDETQTRQELGTP